MLRKVKLYGELADFVGHKELDAVINSTADAIRFLITNFPKLEAHMADRYYKVLVDDYEIGEEDIHNPIGQSDISIVPVIAGAGGGLGKTLLGVALIGFSLASGGGMGVFLKEGFTGLAAIGMNAGIGLTLMGVSEMLFPLPKFDDFDSEQDPKLSFSFNGIQQTNRAGTPVPIVYGEIFTGSVVISASVDTEQVQA